MRVDHDGKSKIVDDFSTRGRVITKSQISKEISAISSTILKESSTSTSTCTINHSDNFAPSEEPCISTSSEDDSSNSHDDESNLHDSNIDLENCFYTNTNIENVVYHICHIRVYHW